MADQADRHTDDLEQHGTKPTPGPGDGFPDGDLPDDRERRPGGDPSHAVEESGDQTPPARG